MRSLPLTRARRIALTAQGFARPRPQAVTRAAVTAQIARLGQFQIDSVNVVCRAHLMPLFSRLGDYPIQLLVDASERPPRRLVEYWGHAASLIDVTLIPALRMRMRAAHAEAWGSVRRVRKDHPGLVEEICTVLGQIGPATARQVDAAITADLPDTTRDNWGWNWSLVKTALEWLLWSGIVLPAHRTSQFERGYDLAERVLPRAIVEAPTPGIDESHRILAQRAIDALGVGTTRCVADYFRLKAAPTEAALRSLAVDGVVEPVRVAGRPAWLAARAQARTPRAEASVVSPFDSMAFERRRLEWLFDFPYRIEIYVPEPKRVFGYYVYPVIAGDRFVARVDLQADRRSGVLLVRRAFSEPGTAQVGDLLEPALERLAAWQGLELAMTGIRPRLG